MTQVSFQQDECGDQELVNLLLFASSLFLASLYSDSKEKGLQVVWDVVSFRVRQEYVGVWSCSGATVHLR